MKNKHPSGLSILFLTEVWERFGFYVVQGLLILYMTNVLVFSDDKSYATLGAFTALAYITPVVGGYIADHVLGFRWSIIVGNILLIVGYALLTIHNKHYLYPALAVIVAGTGFFKPNVSSMLGTLYHEEDPRRDSGYTIFYVGIYLGILLSTSISGFVQEKYGWYASFAIASLGLIIGLIIFNSGKRLLSTSMMRYERTAITSHLDNVLKSKLGFITTVILLVGLCSTLIKDYSQAERVIFGAAILLFIYLTLSALSRPPIERNKFLALIALIIASIVYWALYFQMYFSFNLFVERGVQRHFHHFEIPTVMFMSIQAAFLIILGFPFAKMWHSFSLRKKNISIAFKFSLATFLMGLAFLLLLLGIHRTDYINLVNPLWVAAAYFFVAMSELMLSPIGLSMVTTLAPKNRVGLMMGVWLLALGIGAELAGYIAEKASIPSGTESLTVIFTHYDSAFSSYAIYALVCTVVLLCLTPFLSLLERGINPTLFSTQDRLEGVNE